MNKMNKIKTRLIAKVNKFSLILAKNKAKVLKSRLFRMSLHEAILSLATFTSKQLHIRPRIKLSAKFLLASVMVLLIANYAVSYLKPREAEIKIKGQPILVASEPEQSNNEAEFEQGQAVVSRLSPFEFSKPVEHGYISQGYSFYHRANDIATSFGSPIHPLGSGIVEYAGFTGDGKGNIVVISHGDGLKSLYAHMDKIMVGAGNMVNTSTAIGTIGLTGHTTGPHVHIEIYDGGNMVDPASVLPQN